MDAGTLGQPGVSSLLCLSCHDGTVAIDSFGGATGDVYLDSTTGGWVDTDLSDDHPIGFTWDASLTSDDGELEDPGGTEDLPLFGAKMECATCHNAHDGSATNFLRATNNNSDLCVSCHIK
jgi:predicted CXXCH cytochrome family protein